MKICIRCKESKPLNKFENHPTAKDGKRNQCAACRYSIRVERDPDFRAKQRDWNLGRYGITSKDYDDMMKDQENACAICKVQIKLFVDHDHATGKVRGLLCHACNIILGNAKDSPDILRAALAYLTNSVQQLDEQQ